MTMKAQDAVETRYDETPNRELNVKGIRLAYRDLGKSYETPPLVMLQHFTGTMDDWDPLVVEGFAKARRVVLFDNVGVGRSAGTTPDTVEAMARVVEDFIDALDLRQVDLLGFSLGGFIAQQVLVDRPELVRRAVLVGTAPQGGPGVKDLPLVVGNAIAKGKQTNVHPKTLLFFTGTAAGIEAANAFMSRIGKHTIDADPAASDVAIQAQLKAIVAWGSMPANDKLLEAIAQPVLIVNGSHDVMTPTPNSFAMYQHMPTAQLSLYPDSGHGALFQYHDHFVSQVNDFLSGMR
jgi:pimeloyl-ACP methyl ester carboxylesterase